MDADRGTPSARSRLRASLRGGRRTGTHRSAVAYTTGSLGRASTAASSALSAVNYSGARQENENDYENENEQEHEDDPLSLCALRDKESDPVRSLRSLRLTLPNLRGETSDPSSFAGRPERWPQ